MHLKSLTIRGFKSFARPTTFEFEPGVTAIVGPNGSGKSNVVDALAWVMGEQGAKTLRGGKMEDVIFAGTEAKGPLGRAEVRLTIDNADGALPIDYSEVTISRTLFRSGASEYAINGETCRLLDLQELLSDSGLGREMHVIVGQGQLDAVLRATPEDRRGFIEEAAGILKHRRRKERTLRKLEAMQTNLTRLEDLASEIRRQLKPLGRQAEVARAAQGIAAEVRDAKARILADDVQRLRGELDDLTRTEASRHSERVVLQEQHEQKQLRVSRLEAEQAGDELDAARRITVSLEGAQQRLRGLYSQAQQRLTFLASQAEPLAQPIGIASSSVEEAAAEAAGLDDLIPTSEASWRELQRATARAKAVLDAIDEHIADQSGLVSRHDLRIATLRGALESANQRHQGVERDRERRANALAQAEEREAQAGAALEAFAAAAMTATAGAAGTREAGDQAVAPATPEELSAAHEAALAEQATQEGLRDESRERLAGLQSEHAGVESRVRALDSLVAAPDASAKLLERHGDVLGGRVSDGVQVEPGFEQAVGSALGALAEALVAPTPRDAQQVVAEARADELGVLQLVYASAGADRALLAAADQAAQAAGAAVLASKLVKAPLAVRTLLEGAYAVDTLEQATAVAATLGAHQVAFVVVTAAGDVLTRHTITGGSGQPASSIELTAELAHARERAGELVAEIETAEAQLAAAREAAANAKHEAASLFRAMRDAEARVGETARERGRLSARLESAQADTARAQQAHTVTLDELRQASEAQARAQAELEDAESAPRPILDVSERDGAAGELDAARERELEARLKFETAKERARAASERATVLRAQFDAERRAADEAARREALRRLQVERAERVAAALPEILDACDRSVAEARSLQQQAESARAGRSQELTLLRSEESELRVRLARLTEDTHSSELKSYERRLHLASLLERAGAELGLVESVLLAEYGPDQPVPEVADGAAESGSAAAPPSAPTTVPSGFASTLEAELAAEFGITADGAAASTAAAVAGTANADTDSSAAASAGEQVPEGDRAADAADPAQRGSQAGRPYVREEQQQRLAAAERKLAQLGRINPLALEEFAALEQRHKFLADQLADLNKTRSDLMDIIAGLDEKMQGIFGAAFEDTRRAFEEVFPILFPGGTGEVSLTNPDDLLTTGIDISVRPAGKKVERMSLLSGGERSLAAVAWLMAIFQARPSPFYIVDEVEAALDDANLGRLLQVFERLRENSQLIIITHQKRTMEIADALYGVTMGRDGISQVVGQRVGAEASA